MNGSDPAAMMHFSNATVSPLSRRRRFADSNCAYAVMTRTLRCFAICRETAGQFANDFVFPVTQLVGVNLRLAEHDTVFGHRRRLIDDLCGVQQGFRRYAADIQANAAQMWAIARQG